MATEMKRFTISIYPEMEAKLDEVKRNAYYAKSQTDMIRDLISKGLESLDADSTDDAKESA